MGIKEKIRVMATLNNCMEKDAGIGDAFRAAGSGAKHVYDVAKKGLKENPIMQGMAVYGLALPAIYGVSSSMMEGVGKAYNAAMKGHRMNKMFEVNPTLKEEDQEKVRLAFNTLNKLNPEFANDPLISGTWVKRVLSSDVGEGIMVDPQTAKQLSSDRKGNISKFLGGAIKGMGKGMMGDKQEEITDGLGTNVTPPTYTGPTST